MSFTPSIPVQASSSNVVIFITAFIVAASFFAYYDKSNGSMIYVKSNTDGNEYLVENSPRKQQFADILGDVNNRFKKLINCMRKSCNEDDQCKPYADIVERLASKYHNLDLQQTVDPKYTSYTLNKKSIKLCLTMRDHKDDLVDINTLMFCVLHEISHLGCTRETNKKCIHHNEDFWDVFKFILEESVKCGIYKSVNYKVNPQKYCSITITSNPLFDN